MKVELEVGHEVPSVVGMNLQAALDVLNGAGFEAEVAYAIVEGFEKDQVFAWHRSSGNSRLVVLEVNRKMESKAMIFCKAIQDCTRFSEIRALWKECELEGDPSLEEIEIEIKRRTETERRFGATQDENYMKDYIKRLEERISAIN